MSVGQIARLHKRFIFPIWLLIFSFGLAITIITTWAVHVVNAASAMTSYGWFLLIVCYLTLCIVIFEAALFFLQKLKFTAFLLMSLYFLLKWVVVFANDMVKLSDRNTLITLYVFKNGNEQRASVNPDALNVAMAEIANGGQVGKLGVTAVVLHVVILVLALTKIIYACVVFHRHRQERRRNPPTIDWPATSEHQWDVEARGPMNRPPSYRSGPAPNTHEMVTLDNRHELSAVKSMKSFNSTTGDRAPKTFGSSANNPRDIPELPRTPMSER